MLTHTGEALLQQLYSLGFWPSRRSTHLGTCDINAAGGFGAKKFVFSEHVCLQFLQNLLLISEAKMKSK